MGAKSKFWGRIRAASVHLENPKQAKQPDFHKEKYHNWIDVDHSLINSTCFHAHQQTQFGPPSNFQHIMPKPSMSHFDRIVFLTHRTAFLFLKLNIPQRAGKEGICRWIWGGCVTLHLGFN